MFQERLKQERWEAEQNRANEAEPEPVAEPEPPKPARQLPPAREPEPEPEVGYIEEYDQDQYDDENPYEPTDDSYEGGQVAAEPAAPVSPPAQQHQPEPEPSPYQLEDEDDAYNHPDEDPAQSQGGMTAVALYDYEAGEAL